MLFSKTSIVTGLLAAAVSASPMKSTKRESNSVGENLGIPSDSMISDEGVYFGFAPNYNPQVTMAALNKDTGMKAATYNVYSQIQNTGAYNGNDQYNVDDIISSGAVLIASLMPTGVKWTDITPELCESVASYFTNTFTSKGTPVWLRFAHEMNYYSAVGTYPGGQNYDDFITAWKNMYSAVSGDSKIKMYWSPNEDTSSEPVAPWWPGKDYVDAVGMDVYPNADNGIPSFEDVYGDFYSTYASANGIPFAIGETGIQTSSGSASTAQKEEWLKNIVNPSSGLSNYTEYYCSCTWFEYGPPTNGIDYYIVYDQSAATVQETVSNFENGS